MLYGTDAIFPPTPVRPALTTTRGVASLARGSHREATGYLLLGGQLIVATPQGDTTLKHPSQSWAIRAMLPRPRPSC